MNYRVQVPPISSAHDLQILSPQNEQTIEPMDSEEMKIFRSWAVYDNDLEQVFSPGRSRESLLGLALAMGIGAGFWTAAGLLIARLW
ncbi:MAG: hypothetical protein WA252_02505 [Candidatus Sulfotelmatobacter sp.]